VLLCEIEDEQKDIERNECERKRIEADVLELLDLKHQFERKQDQLADDHEQGWQFLHQCAIRIQHAWRNMKAKLKARKGRHDEILFIQIACKKVPKLAKKCYFLQTEYMNYRDRLSQNEEARMSKLSEAKKKKKILLKKQKLFISFEQQRIQWLHEGNLKVMESKKKVNIKAKSSVKLSMKKGDEILINTSSNLEGTVPVGFVRGLNVRTKQAGLVASELLKEQITA
jgi:hypothetical protein